MHGCPPARGLRDCGYENPDVLITLISTSPPLDPLVEDTARRSPAGHTDSARRSPAGHNGAGQHEDHSLLAKRHTFSLLGIEAIKPIRDERYFSRFGHSDSMAPGMRNGRRGQASLFGQGHR